MSVRIAVGGDAGEAVTRVVPRLVDDRVASGLARQDPALWGPDAEPAAADGLGWTEAVADSRPLVAEVAALRERFAAAGLDRVVLCGTGGATLAAEVIAATQRVPLTVLDSTDPDAVRRVVEDRIATTVVVVASKSGTTPETDAHRRTFEHAFRDAGIDPAERLVVVTDPGTPLDVLAREAGYRVFAGSPTVGGPFSALTAFGLVPSGLAGADLGELLDEAESELLDLAVDQAQNNALVLAAAIAGTNPRRDTLVLVADGTHLVGFGEWVEQLVADTTGKHGTGLVPVVVEVGAPELDAPATDVQVVRFVDDATDDRHDHLLRAGELLLSGTLGELLLVWEHAAAVAARLMGVGPFDAPSTADDAGLRQLLESPAPPPAFEDRGVAVRGARDLLDGVGSLEDALEALLARLPADGYTAVLAYPDPAVRPALRDLREAVARRTGRPATFGWSPRAQHATGRLHRDGPPTGVFLLVTADSRSEDVPVPDRPFHYGALLRAQARSDAEALAARGRPVLHLHLGSDDAEAALLAAAAR